MNNGKYVFAQFGYFGDADPHFGDIDPLTENGSKNR